MPFPPEEIETRRFVPAFRGYDRDEVETFLRAVAADYRKLLQRTSAPPPGQDLVIEIRMSGTVGGAAARVGDTGDPEVDLRNRVVRLQDLVARLHAIVKSHES